MGKNSLPCNNFFCHVLRTCILFSFCQHVFSAKDINGLAGSVPSPERNQKKSGATGTLYSREKCYLTNTVYCDNLRQKTMKKTSILSSQIIMTNTHRCEIGISNGSHYYIWLNIYGRDLDLRHCSRNKCSEVHHRN